MTTTLTARKKLREIIAGGVDEYINSSPSELQESLREIRSAIRAVAPDAIETVSYFDMPGYSYEGFEYNGMFAWFSHKDSFVRLHVRPLALEEHQAELKNYRKTKAIVIFPTAEHIPTKLVKRLVSSSIKDMKASKK